MAMLHQITFLSVVGCTLGAVLRNSSATSALLRGGLNSSSHRASPPCACESNNPTWSYSQRTTPKCIFIDLGAADGNSFKQFLNNGYGPVANCPSGQWEALLIEANPQFTPALTTLANAYPGSLHAYGSTAAYMCQGTTSFSIDPDAANNHWGSSMKKQFGSQTVTVPTVNIMQLVQEHVTQGDWVILKVDIEGAEYDLLPCMANWAHPNLVDIIFVEEHHWLQVDSTYTPAQYASAKMQLKATGVSIPDNYHTQTL
jgi:FkbM family methyltransferase